MIIAERKPLAEILPNVRDAAKALALGADAVSIGQGILISLGCNSSTYVQDGQHIDATADYAALEHRYLRLARKVEKQNHGVFEQG